MIYTVDSENIINEDDISDTQDTVDKILQEIIEIHEKTITH